MTNMNKPPAPAYPDPPADTTQVRGIEPDSKPASEPTSNSTSVPTSEPKSNSTSVPTSEPKARPAATSAVRLPPGVTPRVSSGPQGRKGWGTENAGRPQKDFARRAGKSRKVH
jgi:hypothetical protein